MKNKLLSLSFFFSIAFSFGQINCASVGTGIDGIYHATVNTTLASGTYNYTSFTIDPGVSVNVSGNVPLIIHCTGTVKINGTITVNGGNGSDGITYASAGIAGIGTAGGGNGGDGSYSATNGGLSGVNGAYTGGGIAGLGWSGGGGAGYALPGNSSGGSTGGFGGIQYGTTNLAGLFPGSGGGGGSGGNSCGAGGGGAGGGVIVFNADSLIIGASGQITSNGGNGGSDGTGNCGGGGAGSGGAIWISVGTLLNNGLISAIGGTGGASNIPNSPYYGVGGNGAAGRIRIDYVMTSGTGTVNPTPLAVYSPPFLNQSLTLCNGNSITIGGNTHTTSGNYIDSLISSNGCDSIVHTSLTILPIITSSQSFTLCAEDSIVVGTNIYNTSGTFQDILTNINGCDSAVTTILTMLAPQSQTNSVNLCFGGSIMVGSNSYTVSGIYIDSFIGVLGCDSIITTNLTVESQINNTISTTGGILSSNQNGATYSWIDCDNGNSPINGATNQTFIPTINGNYAVVITNNNCSDTSACFAYNSVGLEDIEKLFARVYPNPSNGIINIEINQVNGPISLKVYDNNGKLQLQTITNLAKSTLNVENLASGIYVIHLQNDKYNYRVKFTRE